jgi:hypothetical protein
MADHWDLPNTGIFYSKDVASGLKLALITDLVIENEKKQNKI